MQTISEDSDPVALSAQADMHRFYIKVILPALTEFAPTKDVMGLETTDLEVFLEAARHNTQNALCYEIRRTFALTIAALFERQLRSWLSGKSPAEARQIEREILPDLIERVKTALGGGAIPELTDIETLYSVANAVRHGKGRAVTQLLNDSPYFWDQARRQEWESDPVGHMRISDVELGHYLKAVLRFWQRAGASSVPAVL